MSKVFYYLELPQGSTWRPPAKAIQHEGTSLYERPWFEVAADSVDCVLLWLAGERIHRADEVAPGGGPCLAQQASLLKSEAVPAPMPAPKTPRGTPRVCVNLDQMSFF